LAELLQDDCRQTTRELAAELDCGQTTVVRHLQSMGYTQKVGMWVPHNLTEINKNQRVTISAALLQRHQQAVRQHRPFLSLIVTGDEKWCLYVNFKKRKSWVRGDEKPTPNVKQDLHPRKCMSGMKLFFNILPHVQRAKKFFLLIQEKNGQKKSCSSSREPHFCI
jgi:[histone H3]-lysine36 N-dimethyltransferase SETMAR